MEKKYEIIKNGLDDYTLKYKDKEINFKANVNIASKLQEYVKNARLKMVLDLTKQGISLSDLTKEIKKDGKTYYDNSNKEELEKIYLEQEQANVIQEILKETLGMTMDELIFDIGIDTEEETKEFAKEIGEVISGRFQ